MIAPLGSATDPVMDAIPACARINPSGMIKTSAAAAMNTVDFRDTGFYDGNRDDSFVELVWKPSPHFGASLSYDYSDVDLPQGSFVTRLVRAGIDFVFSSKLSWVNLIQYDNVTETAGINMRLHFIPQAGRELYFVVNHNAEDIDRDNDFRSLTSDITAKVSYTFRF